MGTYSWRSASLASVGMLVLMVSACKMGPDYVRPETPKADAWRVPTSTAESIANLAWWELLKDKDLQELIRIALTENQDVRTAVASVEQYRAQLVRTRWDLAPALAYGGTALLYHRSEERRRGKVTGVETCALPISRPRRRSPLRISPGGNFSRTRTCKS